MHFVEVGRDLGFKQNHRTIHVLRTALIWGRGREIKEKEITQSI